MENRSLQHGFLLLEQGRHAQAAEVAQTCILEDPNNAMAYLLLAQSLVGQKKFDEAKEASQRAIGLEPDWPSCHYIAAVIAYENYQLKEAREAIDHTIELDPHEPDAFALSAWIHLRKSKWQLALEDADRGLALEADHVSCNNARAQALTQMKRHDEAGQTLMGALSQNPDNSMTHATLGWTFLKNGKPNEALNHFKEALALDPTNGYAQAGIVEGIKAKNVIYAGILKYFFFMSRLSPGAQWGVIIGGWFAHRVGRTSLENAGHPEAAEWLTTFYIIVVVITWSAQPLSNLLLRLHPFGKLALTDEQIKGANLAGLCVGGAVALLAASLIPGFGAYGFVALATIFLLIPVSMIYQLERENSRKQVIYFSIVAAVLIGISVISIPLGGSNGTAALAFLGTVLFSWYGNVLRSKEI